MQLTRIRLSGFKSFSDPVEVRIDEGLTGVVGPNGCGKSNIVEALRWAMGESSARGLRGGEMEDVIFNGSGSRPAFDVAEVRLGLLGPVEGLPDLRGAAEVEVARRISRGQGSVYRINGREARARDVQLLFADAGSGARSPAIIGQGQIGFVVESKPQERRRLLEDAAGIGGLHGRRREAELKLGATEANLKRVLDLLREQEARLAELERQDKQARRYREVAAELREVERLHLLARHRDADSALRAAREAAAAAQAALEAAGTAAGRLRRERGEVAGRLPALRDGLAELAARLATLAERRAQLAAAAERAGAHRAALERQRDEMGADRAAAVSEAEALAAQADRLGDEAGSVVTELAALRPALPGMAAVDAATTAALAAAEEAQRAALAESARAQAALVQTRAALDRSRGRLAELDAALAGLAREAQATPAAAGSEAAFARAAEAVEDRGRRLDAAEANLTSREAEAVSARDAAGRAAAEAARARADQAAAEARHREAQAAARHAAERQAALARSAARLAERERAHAGRLAAVDAARAALDVAGLQAALDAAEAALEDADAGLDATRAQATEAEASRSEAAAAGLEATRALDALKSEIGVLESLAAEVPEGAVLTRLRVPEGMARALAAALGDDLLATDDPEGSALRWRDLGVAEDAPTLPPGVRPLLDPAAAPAALARRLGQVGVVSADDAADMQERLRPGQRLVSVDGGLWRWDGLVRAPEAEEAGAARLRHRLRLDAARQELPALEAALAMSAEAERERAAVLAEARRALAGAESAWREADAAQTRAKQRLAAGRERAAELAVEADRLADEGAGLGRERDELDRERAALPAGATATSPDVVTRERDAARVAAEAAERGQREAARLAEAVERALASARKDVADGRSALEAARREAEQRRVQAEAAVLAAAEAAAGRRARAETLAAEHADLAGALAAMTGQGAEAEGAAAAALGILRAAEEALGEARRGRETAARALASGREREGRLAARLDEVGAARAAAANRLNDARERAAGLAARAARLEAELAAAAADAGTGEDAAALDTELGELEGRRRIAEAALREGEARLAALERSAVAAEAAASDARERLALAKEGRARAETSLDAAVLAIRERLQARPEDLLAEPGTAAALEAANPAALEPKLERLRASRERLGAVNLRAAEEADELRQTVARTTAEADELREAVARLNQAITRLNREGRERLAQMFEVVDGHFRDLFGRLFGGGRAQLRLVDADDPLECGLELEACPPGKRLSSISLLSGGEKTLAALALVFAFFLAQPSPLCVLDEVDAPLDDANVDRFVSLMREIAGQTGTRFLVVTHHPLTMARMDRLYGVTMSERGVSRLVSVALAEAVAAAAEDPAVPRHVTATAPAAHAMMSQAGSPA